MRQSWSRSVKFWQRYENQQILVIQCISPSKPVRFASFLFHWMRKRNIRTLLYYNFLWMSAILMWKIESYMDRNWCHWLESLPGIESDPARLNWMAGPLFPSFTGSVPLPLMDWWISSQELNQMELTPRHWVPGMEWKNVRSSCFFQHIQTDPADSQALSPGKMLEVVAACNVFKQMQPTCRHSNGPGDLYFQASLGQFHRAIGCTCLRTQCTHLRMY